MLSSCWEAAKPRSRLLVRTLSGSVHRVRESCWHEAARNPKAVLAAAAVIIQQSTHKLKFYSKSNPQKKENRQTALHNCICWCWWTHRWPKHTRRQPTTTRSRWVETTCCRAIIRCIIAKRYKYNHACFALLFFAAGITRTQKHTQRMVERAQGNRREEISTHQRNFWPAKYYKNFCCWRGRKEAVKRTRIKTRPMDTDDQKRLDEDENCTRTGIGALRRALTTSGKISKQKQTTSKKRRRNCGICCTVVALLFFPAPAASRAWLEKKEEEEFEREEGFSGQQNHRNTTRTASPAAVDTYTGWIFPSCGFSGVVGRERRKYTTATRVGPACLCVTRAGM